MITLRLGVHHVQEAECRRLLEAIAKYPGCCDEVWLTTLYGFPPMEKHHATYDLWRTAAKAMRESGLRVSVQISNTIGHGQYMQSQDCTGLNNKSIEVQHMVGHDGAEAEYCFCVNDPVFRAYTKSVVMVYSEIQPHTVWLDDDLRPEWHAPADFGCFCPRCMRLFNERHHTAYTREELSERINAGSERENWAQFIRDNLYDFTKMLTEAIISVSPNSTMGYQYPAGSVYTGEGNPYIYQAMLDGSGRAPKSRPGHGFYSDLNPIGMVEKAYRIAYANSALPEYVSEMRPEIENTPDVPFGKSIYGTLVESSLYLAYGCNALSYAAIMTTYESMDWHEGLLKGFAEHRTYWQRLIDAGQKTKLGGVAIAGSENLYLHAPLENEKPFDWTVHRWPSAAPTAQYGMPLGFDRDTAQVIMLTPELAEVMPIEDIEALKKRPVITETKAIDILMRRGVDFGLTLQPLDLPTISEMFTEHPVNEGIAGQKWRAGFINVSKWLLSGRAMEPISLYVSNVDGHEYGVAGAIIQMNGAKWAVIGSGLTDTVISSARRAHILNATDYVCGHTLPAMVLNADKLIVIPRIDENGRCVCVSVLNYGIGPTEEPIGILIRNPASEQFTYHNQDNETTTPEVRRAEKGMLVTIPALNGWSIGTVFVEK